MDRVNAFAVVACCLSAALVAPTANAAANATASVGAAVASIPDATNATIVANATQAATTPEGADASDDHATSAEGFCRSLAELESHLTRGLEAENNSTYGRGYECACGDFHDPGESDESEKSFAIDCVMNATDDGTHGDETFLSSERMVFELKDGEYSLSTTSWGWHDSSVSWDAQEAYHFENGALAGCKANACKSCEICEDDRSIAVDCSNVKEPGQWYRYGCGRGYTGSFANTFDFGTIAGEEDAEAESSTDSAEANDGADGRDEFCSSLGGLESHMTEKFEKRMDKTYTTSFECACDELSMNEESFAVDCAMEGSGGGATFTASERMIFESNQGKYEPNETSWSWEDSDEVELPNRGVYHLEDGAVTGCVADGCTSCKLCNAGISIKADCDKGVNWKGDGHARHYFPRPKAQCSKGYVGALSHSFDFGEIVAADGALTGTQATETAAVATATAASDAGDASNATSATNATVAAVATDGTNVTDVTNASMTTLATEAATAAGASAPNAVVAPSAEPSNATSAAEATQTAASTAEEGTDASMTQESPVVLAASVDRDEFCKNLTRLEAHMIQGLEAENNRTYDTNYECACGDSDEDDKSFSVECSMEALDYYNGGNKTVVMTECMAFELKQGKYSLQETSWGWKDSHAYSEAQEVYQLDDGVVTGCKANSCTSCSVCDDHKTIAVDCSNVERPGVWYKYGCDNIYTGSFANTFDFGVITGEDLEYASTPDSAANSAANVTIVRDAFCLSLNSLESHMTEMFEEKMGKTYTTRFNCACGELDEEEESFDVFCLMKGSADGVAFEASERIVFDLDDGEYELNETSWRWVDSEGSDLPNQGVFHLKDGVVTRCEATGCTSCKLCDDGTSIKVDCSNSVGGSILTPSGSHGHWKGDGHARHYIPKPAKRQCSEGYTGALSHSFDFGKITAVDDVPAATKATDAASTLVTGASDVITTATLPVSGAMDKEEFCENLTSLEAHMDDELTSSNDAKYVGSYECACGESDRGDESFSVDCSLRGDDVTFERTEHLLFRLNEGRYELVETSLSWEDPNGSVLPNFEEYSIENGKVTSCKAEICNFCAVCEDGKSVAVNCSNLEIGGYEYDCGDGYAGSFAHTFVFGAIVPAADASTTTGATEAVTTTMTQGASGVNDTANTAVLTATRATEEATGMTTTTTTTTAPAVSAAADEENATSATEATATTATTESAAASTTTPATARASADTNTTTRATEAASETTESADTTATVQATDASTATTATTGASASGTEATSTAAATTTTATTGASVSGTVVTSTAATNAAVIAPAKDPLDATFKAADAKSRAGDARASCNAGRTASWTLFVFATLVF